MSIKQIHVCDGCGKVLEKNSDSYHLNLKTDRFWNSVEMDYLEKNLEFCEFCARDIKNSLVKIANQLKTNK